MDKQLICPLRASLTAKRAATHKFNFDRRALPIFIGTFEEVPQRKLADLRQTACYLPMSKLKHDDDDRWAMDVEKGCCVSVPDRTNITSTNVSSSYLRRCF